MRSNASEVFKKDFYFFRHAKSLTNQTNIWCGATFDPDLNETGLEQAKELRHRLENKNLDIIFSSPLVRAVHTSKIVGTALGLEVLIEDDLKEVHYGIAEGMYVPDVFAQYPETARNYFYPKQDALHHCFEGGESLQVASDRAWRVMNKLKERPENVFGVAVHAGFMVVMLSNLGLVDVDIANCDCFHVVYEGETGWRVEERF